MRIYNMLKQKAIEDKIYSLILGGIIFVNDKILLIKRASNKFMRNLYEFPSGKLEFGETFEQCLKRHINEELNCQIEDIVGYVGNFDYLSENGHRVRQYNFLITLKDIDNITLSSGHTEFGFFSISDCNSLIDISPEVLYTINVTTYNKILNGRKR